MEPWLCASARAGGRRDAQFAAERSSARSAPLRPSQNQNLEPFDFRPFRPYHPPRAWIRPAGIDVSLRGFVEPAAVAAPVLHDLAIERLQQQPCASTSPGSCARRASSTAMASASRPVARWSGGRLRAKCHWPAGARIRCEHAAARAPSFLPQIRLGQERRDRRRTPPSCADCHAAIASASRFCVARTAPVRNWIGPPGPPSA